MFDGFFRRRVHAFELVGVAAQRPFVRAKFVVRQQFDFFDVVHRRDVLAEEVGGVVVIAVAGDDDVADAGKLVSFLQVFGEHQGAVVWHADEFFVDFVVKLFEVEHDEVGVIKQFFEGFVVMAGVAVGIEAGVDAVGFAGDEPVADEFGLEQ